jgi:hypothetical protein
LAILGFPFFWDRVVHTYGLKEFVGASILVVKSLKERWQPKELDRPARHLQAREGIAGTAATPHHHTFPSVIIKGGMIESRHPAFGTMIIVGRDALGRI